MTTNDLPAAVPDAPSNSAQQSEDDTSDYAPWLETATGERYGNKRGDGWVYAPRATFPPDTRDDDERFTPSDPMEEMHRDAVIRYVAAETALAAAQAGTVLLDRVFAALDGEGISFQYGEYRNGRPATIGGIASFTSEWDSAPEASWRGEDWDTLTPEQKFESSKFSAQHQLVTRLAEIKAARAADPGETLHPVKTAAQAEARKQIRDRIDTALMRVADGSDSATDFVDAMADLVTEYHTTPTTEARR
jgi:hypothetical protein